LGEEATRSNASHLALSLRTIWLAEKRTPRKETTNAQQAMIFTVQRFLEDHFEQRGLADIDQYAVKVANLYERLPSDVSTEALVRELARLRTAFFRRNRAIDRKPFELKLAF